MPVQATLLEDEEDLFPLLDALAVLPPLLSLLPLRSLWPPLAFTCTVAAALGGRMSPASLGAALAGALCCCCRGCCCRDCCCCCRDCCCCRGCCCWVVGAAAGALGCCCCWPAPWRTLRSLISDPLKMMKSKISSEGSIWADPLHPLKREATQRERMRPLSAWGRREKKIKGGTVLSDPPTSPLLFFSFLWRTRALARPAVQVRDEATRCVSELALTVPRFQNSSRSATLCYSLRCRSCTELLHTVYHSLR